MLRTILVSIILIKALPASGQEKAYSIVTNYEYFRKPETSPFTILYNSILTINDSSSLYEIKLKNINDSTRTMVNETGSYTMLNEKTNAFYYKDLYRKKIFNIEKVLLKRLLVQDDLDIFQWVMASETKNILGYTCLSAKTKFRGRDYIAYYALDIPVNNGPWKFHGLPGLILEIHTTDENFRISAVSVNINKDRIAIPNPYKNQKSISRREYEELYHKKYDEVERYKGDDGSTMKMSKGAIEIIVTD